ncbi:MAG: hypothetical protein HKN76_10490 [Saprospiraceae bacterium]|nr:hypothetical protein [Saprospiraceae bacterium]
MRITLYLMALGILFTQKTIAQIIIPVDPKMQVETSLNGQVAIEGYSGPIGQIVPPPTNPGSIGVLGIGFSGVKGEAKADAGHGVWGLTKKDYGHGVFGEASGVGADGVQGTASGTGGWGVYGRATGEGEWGGYFSGGKGLLARPRLGVENFDPQHPIHVGTASNNGNGAHVTNGGIWTNGSSRSFKDRFQKIDAQEILVKLSELEISKWTYKNSAEGLHIGPMAEDFYQSFGLGHDERYISTTDADGIALAAIQALYLRLLELEAKNHHLQTKLHRVLSKKLK